MSPAKPCTSSIYTAASMATKSKSTIVSFSTTMSQYPADAEWVQAIRRSTHLTNVSLHYDGMTAESTPTGRHNADLASPPPSRLGNIITHFQGIGVTNWKIYEWTGLSRSVRDADAVRTVLVMGDIERSLIALMRGRGLNSA
ncbi:unnamed protein product [Mortierella alpina]